MDKINPQHLKAEAYAIAPYIGGSIAGDVVASGTNASVSDLLAMLQNTLTHDVPVPGEVSKVRKSFEKTVQENKALAERYGVALVAYEGGQHLTLNGQDSALNEKLMSANRDPKMYDIYHSMLDLWFKNGGGTFAAYSFVGGFNKWGSWPALEWIGQPTDQAPKYRALRDFLKK